MKKFFNIILILLAIFISFNVEAKSTNNTIDTQENKTKLDDNFFNNISFNKNVAVWNKWELNLQKEKKQAEKKYNSRILFEWNQKWEPTISGPLYKIDTQNFWEKDINLSIYKVDWKNKTILTNKEIKVFVYKVAIPLISEENQENKINEYTQKAKESWILIYNLAKLNNTTLYKTNIIEKYYSFKNTFKNTSDYLIIWWNKDFIFDVISKINRTISKKINIKNKLNIILISSYNIDLLQSYLQNFISNKKWIWKILLLDEWSKYEILKQPTWVDKLENEIQKNKYEYVNLSKTKNINNYLFISKFVNYLSNQWYSTQNIYLIIIIPFLLFWVSVFKHLLWLTTIWVLIPTIITISMLKFWIIATIILLIVFLITNLILSKFINKYKLHYTPKVTLLTIINIIVFIITLNILVKNSLIKIDINDIMFFIFFILISEKLITVIISKEFWEYKNNLINTLIFAFVSYLIFNIDIIKTLLLSYPELIILLIPLLFMIWKFTGLRVTEYFRFREVIKSIEE